MRTKRETGQKGQMGETETYLDVWCRWVWTVPESERDWRVLTRTLSPTCRMRQGRAALGCTFGESFCYTGTWLVTGDGGFAGEAGW